MKKNFMLVFVAVFLIVLISLSVVSAGSNKGYKFVKSIRKYSDKLEDLDELKDNHKSSINLINERIIRDNERVHDRLVYWQDEYEKEVLELDAECDEKVGAKEISKCLKHKKKWLKKLESWKKKDMKSHYKVQKAGQKALAKVEKSLAKTEKKYDKYEAKLQKKIMKYGDYLWSRGLIDSDCRDLMKTGVMCG